MIRGSGLEQAEKAHAYLGGHERERAKRVAFAFGPAALISVLVGGGGRSQSDTRARKNHRRRRGRGRITFCIKRRTRDPLTSSPLLFLSARPERVLFAEKIDIFHRAAAD